MNPNMFKRSVILLHFFKGLGEVGVFFAEVVSNSKKVTRFPSPQFHQLKGKTSPSLGSTCVDQKL